MRRLTRAFIFLASLSSIPAIAHAQASIAGVVKDSSGAVLPGVTVEAASDVLIEKVRIAVTDSTGQFRVVDLRPGTYSVTFKLTGFSAVRREGIELTGVATAIVNADLRVGALSETITVTGETPIVDVQSARRQTTVTNEVLNSLPTARAYGAVMQLIPSLITQASFTPGARDVQVTPGMSVFGGAGGRENEGRLQVDGINTGASVNGAGVSGYIADVTNAQEVAFTTSGGLGEVEVGGPTMSIVPKTGGNSIKGSLYLAGVADWMVGNNYTPELQAAGLSVPGQLLKLWDIAGGLGGPIVKDRLWYFLNVRNEGAHRSVPGMYANLNAGNPNKRTYEADLTRQSRSAQAYMIQNLRLTVQATPRNKFGFFWDEQIPCNGSTWSSEEDGCRNQPTSGFIYGGTATISPEAGGTLAGGSSGGYGHKFQRVQQVTWSSPLTSRLLLEAGFGTYLSRYGSNEQPGNPTRDMVRVTEQCTAGCSLNGGIPGLVYRSQDWEYNWIGAHTWRASASYVTGAHNMKFGYQGAFHVYDPMVFTNNLFLAYQVNNGTPNQLTESLNPFDRKDRVRYHSVYGQEQWTYGRMTLQGALRYDHAWSYFPEQRVGGTRFLPSPIVFPETPGVTGFNDITPRVGVAYDVFGNGKTSLKLNVGKYLEAAAALGIYSAANPVTRISTTGTRAWTDANANYIPDCDLLNRGTQDLRPTDGDFCGPVNPQTFSTSTFANTIDPNALGGSGVRSADWQIGVSIQQEVLPRVSVEAGYYRRWLKGFLATDNLAVSPADFTPFSINAPLDPRLPGGGGYVVSGLYNVVPIKFGQTSNFITLAENFGTQYQRYNGLMVNINARPRNGLTLQGGVNAGKTVTDSCEIRDLLPELTVVGVIGPTNPYCHSDPGLVTRLSGLAAYTIPKLDVLISGTFRSDPGLPLAANWAASNQFVQPALGRPISGGLPTVTINLVAPGDVWGDRVNELDLRIAKILRFGRTRTNVGFDLYNLLNSSAVLSYNQNFVPNVSWLRPTLLLTSRFAKISATIDF
jgi:Carboxypeptidase regulatory-like domain